MGSKKLYDAAIPVGASGLPLISVPSEGYRYFFITFKNLDPAAGNSVTLHLHKSAYGIQDIDFLEDLVASGKLGTLPGGLAPGSNAFVSIENEQLAGIKITVDSPTGCSRFRIGFSAGEDEDDMP